MKERLIVVCQFLLLTVSNAIHAQEGLLRLQVADVQRRPVQGLLVSPLGGGSVSPPTTELGRTELRLPAGTQPGSSIPLQLARLSSEQPDWVFVDPWDGRARIPRFDTTTDNFVQLVVTERGNRQALESDTGLRAVTASILAELKEIQPLRQEVTEEQRQRVLQEQAQKYGLAPEEIDRAIRDWQQRADDPYELGLAALYAREYPEATEQLSASLRIREDLYKDAAADLVDAAFFLGQSLHAQGRYRAAAESYRKAAEIRGDDPAIFQALGRALLASAQYEAAQDCFERARKLLVAELGPAHPDVGMAINSLARLYEEQGRYQEAETLYRQALKIKEEALGPNDPEVATTLDNVARVARRLARYGEAEALYQRALEIKQGSLPPTDASIAVTLDNLAVLYAAQGRSQEAEPLYQRALQIKEEALGPEHPNLALSLDHLATFYVSEGHYQEAEPLLERALSIQKEALGAEHPHVGLTLEHLASLYVAQGRYAGTEALFQRALKLMTDAWGSRHPDVALADYGLAKLYVAQGRPAKARVLYERALDIMKAAVGADHPDTRRIRRDYKELRMKFPGAEPATFNTDQGGGA